MLQREIFNMWVFGGSENITRLSRAMHIAVSSGLQWEDSVASAVNENRRVEQRDPTGVNHPRNTETSTPTRK
jgi:hypothetical protein